jgi:Grx4 family monothiol glutaredoxin
MGSTMCTDEPVPRASPVLLPLTADDNRVFESLAKQSSPQSAVFITIDAEEFPDISESYEVSAVPFFVLLKNKATVEKISGADPAKLSTAITKYSGATTTFTLPLAQTATSASLLAETNGDTTEEPEEDINTRLAKLVKAAPVMLFMKGTPAAPQCGFSRQLVATLREKGVRYGFFNILADDEVRQGLKTFSDWPTYPQLYVLGELIGGLDIVKEEFEHDPDFLSNLSSPA